MNMGQSSVFNSSLPLRRKPARKTHRQANRVSQPSSSPTLVSTILLERERELQDRLHRVKSDLRLIAFTRATTKSQSTRRACLLRAAIHSRRRRAIESRLGHVRKIREDALRVESLRNEAQREVEQFGANGIDEELDEVALREGWNQAVDEFEDLKGEVAEVSERLGRDWSGINDTELEEELDQEMKDSMGRKHADDTLDGRMERESSAEIQTAHDGTLSEEGDEEVEAEVEVRSEAQRVLDLLPVRRAWDVDG
ncbi:LPXTG cell wall anchor domain containing protein [Gracilaria domingensis]|nr:LPXTG cell wall anchor domain containing protein [Gracilaria domingensis]